QASLQDLGDAIEAACGVAYTAYLEDGNDVGGIDVGFLTRDDRITVDSSTQFLLASTWPDPECTPAPCARSLHDRPPLLLRGTFRAAPDAAPFPFAVMNNHTRSRG